jgi:hypothetical protein
MLRTFRGDLPRLARDGVISVVGGVIAGTIISTGGGSQARPDVKAVPDEITGDGVKTTDEPDEGEKPKNRFRERKVEAPHASVQVKIQNLDAPTLRPEFELGDADEELGRTREEQRVEVENFHDFPKEKFVYEEFTGTIPEHLKHYSMPFKDDTQEVNSISDSPLAYSTPQPRIRASKYYRQNPEDVGTPFFLPNSNSRGLNPTFVRRTPTNFSVKEQQIRTVRVIPPQVKPSDFIPTRDFDYKPRFRSAKAY